jgi:hypothetical protein
MVATRYRFCSQRSRDLRIAIPDTQRRTPRCQSVEEAPQRDRSTALVLQGATGGLLGPAIAAISLGIVGHSELAERLTKSALQLDWKRDWIFPVGSNDIFGNRRAYIADVGRCPENSYRRHPFWQAGGCGPPSRTQETLTECSSCTPE